MRAQLRVEINGAPWLLLSERAAYWPARRWLVVADVHFGKAATFRALGVPVPHGTTSDTLTRLSRLVDRLDPTTIVFLGDLFHAPEAHAAATLAALYEWRERYPELELILVEGNHDRSAGATPAALRIQTQADPWRVGSFAFCHYPRFVESAFALAGHLHPAIRLQGRAADSIRLPCFWWRGGSTGLMVLPAFGSFTGGAAISREYGDRVIAAADDRVVEVPALRHACGQNT